MEPFLQGLFFVVVLDKFLFDVIHEAHCVRILDNHRHISGAPDKFAIHYDSTHIGVIARTLVLDVRCHEIVWKGMMIGEFSSLSRHSFAVIVK